MNMENLSALAEKTILADGGALKEFKTQHLKEFQTKGLKSPVVDSYKFTNLESFFAGFSETGENEQDAVIEGELPSFVFKDGKLLSSPALPKGVKVRTLRDNFGEVKDLLKDTNALSHLHHSLLGEGIILEVEKNVELKAPLRILNIVTKNTITAPTHLVLAGAFSKLSVIEETKGSEIPHAQISETYLIAREGSKVEHIQLDQESTQGLNHGSLFCEVDKDAEVRSLIFNATGKLNRKNLTLNLNHAGAHGESFSLYLTSGSEHSDVSTVINHRAADTTSAQIAKGILDGDSKGIFTGLIHILPKAQRVASSQLNKNLLLSKKAQVHSQPQLEIFADDVKCSHGSTTGQLSDDEVFYFQARGIPAEKAKTLLAHGFGMEIVQKISNTEARKYVGDLILRLLETKFDIGRMV